MMKAYDSIQMATMSHKDDQKYTNDDNSSDDDTEDEDGEEKTSTGENILFIPSASMKKRRRNYGENSKLLHQMVDNINLLSKQFRNGERKKMFTKTSCCCCVGVTFYHLVLIIVCSILGAIATIKAVSFVVAVNARPAACDVKCSGLVCPLGIVDSKLWAFRLWGYEINMSLKPNVVVQKGDTFFAKYTWDRLNAEDPSDNVWQLQCSSEEYRETTVGSYIRVPIDGNYTLKVTVSSLPSSWTEVEGNGCIDSMSLLTRAPDQTTREIATATPSSCKSPTSVLLYDIPLTRDDFIYLSCSFNNTLEVHDFNGTLDLYRSNDMWYDV